MRIPLVVSSHSRASVARAAHHGTRIARFLLAAFLAVSAQAASVAEHPWPGVTSVTIRNSAPRNYVAHAIVIDLSTPGLRFFLTSPGGKRETIRQTTLEFADQLKAQVAINAHFFLPFPSAEPDADLIGLAASNGKIYSQFEIPAQAYALVANAPAIGLDRKNHPSLLRRGDDLTGVWTAVSGSAQIVTAGKVTIPIYRDDSHPEGQLNGPSPYSNQDSWYERPQARTALGIADQGRTLVLFVADRAGGSQGLTVSEVAALLSDEFHVTDALNLDGGGSSTLVLEDPVTHQRSLANASSDNPKGRSVGSNLAVFIPSTQSTLTQPTQP